VKSPVLVYVGTNCKNAIIFHTGNCPVYYLYLKR
jgi:hypothetical protein